MRRLFVLVLGFSIVAAPADVLEGGFGAKRSKDAPAPGSAPPANSKARAKSYPFSGILDAVDTGAQTITLKGKAKNRVILVTNSTRIFRTDVKSTLDKGVPGERVSGAVRKNEDGKEEAITVRFGPRSKN